MVKISGEVDVGDAHLGGTVSVSGPIVSDSLASHGTLEADGPIRVSARFSSDGRLTAGGPVAAGEASFTGTTRVTREVIVTGALNVRGQFAAASVRSGELRGDGGFEIPGALEATEVDVRIRRDSRFGSIRARTVRLIRIGPNPVERAFGRSPPTPIARIEADRLELEGVDVAFVRCPEVVLGRDAHITELEGTVVRRHATARVGPRSVSPPPYGLRR
jgi:hypothetical protein